MKKKVIFLTLLVIMALMVLTTASFADARGRGNFAGKQGAPYHNQGQNYYPSERFGFNQGDNYRQMRNLELSSEQMAQIREMILTFQKETLELRQQIQTKQLELRELRLSSDTDLNQVKAKLEEVSKLQLEIRMKSFERQQEVKEILTPEQLENCRQGFQMQRFSLEMGRFNSNRGRGYRGICR